MASHGVLRSAEGGHWLFMCPGCREVHVVGPSWQFNGNCDRPTFSPSILVQGHAVERDDAGKWTGGWLRDPAGNLVQSICHSFIRDGQIKFIHDSTHPLAGQTVPLSGFQED